MVVEVSTFLKSNNTELFEVYMAMIVVKFCNDSDAVYRDNSNEFN